MKNKIIELLMFVIFLSLLVNSFLVTEELKYALDTFLYVLFPSIFPFFLISDLLIEYNFVNTLNKFFSKITEKVFHVTSASSFIIIMSMVSGFPSGSKYIRNLYDKKMLSLDQANYLITFTHFANPLFVLTVTRSILDSKTSIYLLVSMYLSNFIIGFITRPKEIDKTITLENKLNSNFSFALSTSIKNSIDLLIIILGNTCFFFLVSKLICNYFSLNDFTSTLINGFFDITKGIQSIKFLNTSKLFKGILTISFICFGGINIHMQVKNIIEGTKIKYSNFLLGRICQIAISSIIFIFLINKTFLGIH